MTPIFIPSPGILPMPANADPTLMQVYVVIVLASLALSLLALIAMCAVALFYLLRYVWRKLRGRR